MKIAYSNAKCNLMLVVHILSEMFSCRSGPKFKRATLRVQVCSDIVHLGRQIVIP